MALHPIDLQTLYSQLDNVSKNIASQQQVAQLRGNVQQDAYGRKINEREKAVKETAQDESAVLTVKDQNRKNNGGSSGRREKEKEEPETDLGDYGFTDFKEPGSGGIIDIQS